MPPRLTEAEIDAHLSQILQFGSFSSGPSHTESVAHLGPVLRSINQSKQQDAFLRQLKLSVASKESEIEEVCKVNYQDFVKSTDKLLKVREGTVSLKHRVAELNEDIQSKGGELAAKKKILLDTRRVGQNIEEAIDTLQASLRVLDLSAKISGLLADKRYYSALKSLDDLEQHHLRTVMHLPFAKHMMLTIPTTRQEIRDAATEQVKTWLFQARESSRVVGQAALDSMDQRTRRWKARKAKDTDGTLRSARVNGAVELAFSERHETNVFDSEDVSIDFRTLYHCILIHEALGKRDDMLSFYADNRRQQANILISSATLSPLSVPALCALLEEMAGFFIIEAHVLQTTQDFRPQQDVDDLWDSLVDRLISSLRSSFLSCNEAETYLECKMSLYAFSLTVESFGYTVNILNNFVQSLYQRFPDILEKRTSLDLEQIISEDEHQSMLVSDIEDFEKVASVSWLPTEGQWSEAQLRNSDFPAPLPFSQTYPLCCIDIRNLVDQFYQFTESLPRPAQDVDETIKKMLDRMLTDRISLKIRNRSKNMANISQIALIMVNLLFFETACCELESLLAMFKDRNSAPVELTSVTSFRETLDITEKRMSLLISRKLDNFFGMATYDWAADHMPTPLLTDEPSTYLTEMVDYLTLIMKSVLVQLPDALRTAIYREALQHCADTLMAYFTEPEPSRMSDTGLSYFANDVRFIVQHAADAHTVRMDDVFEELSQMVSLLQSDTIDNFLDPDIRELAFPRVQGRKLQFALIKLVTYWNSLPTGSKSMIDPRRRREVEDVRSLSQLVLKRKLKGISTQVLKVVSQT